MAISGLTRASFAASGIAGGLVANGVSFFLLIYYSQVLGLDPALAGLAMMVSLAFDAVTDPLVGHWSDRLRHRLGRRHPFLFW
ncbi:MAG: MFS transporter, partial [Gammaproteobacteria bacterium]|nr:MFS transporter [Gammaproteobacteria bacterium]